MENPFKNLGDTTKKIVKNSLRVGFGLAGMQDISAQDKIGTGDLGMHDKRDPQAIIRNEVKTDSTRVLGLNQFKKYDITPPGMPNANTLSDEAFQNLSEVDRKKYLDQYCLVRNIKILTDEEFRKLYPVGDVELLSVKGLDIKYKVTESSGESVPENVFNNTSFKEAFQSAERQGFSTFNWNGNDYLVTEDKTKIANTRPGAMSKPTNSGIKGDTTSSRVEPWRSRNDIKDDKTNQQKNYFGNQQK